MRIIRPGIADMRYVPERLPVRLGFECPDCGCVFEAEYDEVRPVSLYGNYGRILSVEYTCICPNCKKRLMAESYSYEEE